MNRIIVAFKDSVWKSRIRFGELFNLVFVRDLLPGEIWHQEILILYSEELPIKLIKIVINHFRV